MGAYDFLSTLTIRELATNPDLYRRTKGPRLPTRTSIMAYRRSAGVLNADGIHVDMQALKAGEVDLGTTIMAITFKDGVILGADSRTTTGPVIANRVTDKLTMIDDNIWCCRSGSACGAPRRASYNRAGSEYSGGDLLCKQGHALGGTACCRLAPTIRRRGLPGTPRRV